MMNLLQKNQLIFKNKKYQINAAFPLVLEYFKYIGDDEHLTIPERLNMALFSFVKESTSELSAEDKMELLEKIYSSFIFTKKDKEDAELINSKKKSFDYEQDMDLIYSSFLQQYGIDLSDKRIFTNLTWSKFNSLLQGLTDDTSFRKVTSYRTVKITDDMSSETQNYLKQMKLIYSLDRKDNDGDGKLTKVDLDMILAPLDMVHKVKKIKELRDQGRIK
ncbi:bacteriophage Gp15 family protein [Companilactobacillus allii]|uniref:EF-hand domain-containing protein n=1 Tax=Companilactobacillus allii TaxID=1847728 RepID=A0A1P8Q4S4_9LACO|nr:Gp15 family bacteriophage protein [Companilactobacillus allii]APX72860.1 hypothetical protein BTM29_09995 [Companilactobacillus allii]USQ67648.1 bacteriophage Gp15 family protein [Companilactobacillus allii]